MMLAAFCFVACVCGLKSERTSRFGAAFRAASASFSRARLSHGRRRAVRDAQFAHLRFAYLRARACSLRASSSASSIQPFAWRLRFLPAGSSQSACGVGRRAMAGSSFSALLRAVARASVLCLLSGCVVGTGVVACAALACFTAGPFFRSALEVCRRFFAAALPVACSVLRFASRLAHPRASRCAFARSSRGSACVTRALASTLLFALVDRRRRRSTPDCLCAAHVAG